MVGDPTQESLHGAGGSWNHETSKYKKKIYGKERFLRKKLIWQLKLEM